LTKKPSTSISGGSSLDYSFKEREHLVLNERNRISQELHDSLGHSLMALSMNVKYIKAIKDREKINHEINELESLISKNIQSLRETVYNLRKLDENFSLHNEITSIISKFNKLNIIKITLDYDNNIEKSSIAIKNILISTIKESITNSLKHGNSAKIFISIKLIRNTIKLIIKDNGDGCSCIIKSEGLAGIENRFKTFNGTINFITSPNKGFTITASIPEVIIDDKSNDS
jgi:signal transduction histidine kinase